MFSCVVQCDQLLPSPSGQLHTHILHVAATNCMASAQPFPSIAQSGSRERVFRDTIHALHTIAIVHPAGVSKTRERENRPEGWMDDDEREVDN